MRLDERVARRRAAGHRCPGRDRLHGVHRRSRRPTTPLTHGETLDIGGHVVQWFDTPHVPHGWEAGVLYDATTRTLFCGDLFARYGEYEATTTEDIVGPAVQAEDDAPGSLSLHPSSAAVIRTLAELPVDTLALMHGPTFTGDCRAALLDLADDFDRRVTTCT